MFTCLFLYIYTHIQSSISIKQSRNQINETQLKVHVIQLIERHIIHRKFTRLRCVTEFLNSANGSYPDTTTIPVTSSSRVKFLAEGNKAIAVSIYLHAEFQLLDQIMTSYCLLYFTRGRKMFHSRKEMK